MKTCPDCGKTLSKNKYVHCKKHAVVSETSRLRIPKYGEENNNWKGVSAGYSAIHAWMINNYGSGEKCEECGEIGKKNGRRWNLEWANLSGKFLRERSDWKILCKKCHYHLDEKSYRKEGIYVSAKLTPEDVREIRNKYATGLYTLKQIGSKYGIHKQTVLNLFNRTSWRHLV